MAATWSIPKMRLTTRAASAHSLSLELSLSDETLELLVIFFNSFCSISSSADRFAESADDCWSRALAGEDPLESTPESGCVIGRV